MDTSVRSRGTQADDLPADSLIARLTAEAQAVRDADSAAVHAYAAEHGLDARTLAGLTWSSGRQFVAQADEFDAACDKVERMLKLAVRDDEAMRFARARKLAKEG